MKYQYAIRTHSCYKKTLKTLNIFYQDGLRKNYIVIGSYHLGLSCYENVYEFFKILFEYRIPFTITKVENTNKTYFYTFKDNDDEYVSVSTFMDEIYENYENDISKIQFMDLI